MDNQTQLEILIEALETIIKAAGEGYISEIARAALDDIGREELSHG